MLILTLLSSYPIILANLETSYSRSDLLKKKFQDGMLGFKLATLWLVVRHADNVSSWPYEIEQMTVA